ncbi:MAG: phosphatidate cytidylyltransferase [Actinomycetota bacterium]
MADDTTKDGSEDFDDWLDEQPGPPTDPTDPYKELASDDADEISEWMAFTEGTPPETVKPDAERQPQASEPGDETAAETGEIEALTADAEESGVDDQADETDRFDDQDLQNAETVEIDAVDGDAPASDDDGPPEVPAVAEGDSDDSDDTGDIDVIPIAPYGGYTSEADETPPQSRELFDLSESDYLSTATTEHSDLAEAIAVASAQDTEQVPIAAPIPGMTDTVVGFEDVVEAEGIGRVRARASGDLIARVVTAIILIIALLASMIWQPALAIFALVVFVLGAGEFYTSLVRADHKPIGLFGFVGIIGASVGAYFWGSLAIPIAFIAAVAMLLLYYAVVPNKVDPLGNLALTITVMAWVGLGAYTMLIVVSDSYRPLVIGVVVTVAAMDIGQFFVGRAIGRTQMSPWVSPKKTVEGLVAGIFIALVFGALLHFVEPFELTSGLALGVAVAILAPIGDLAMSAAKRSLGLKDMGSVLPGHGGFLDRIDGLLFVIPAAWLIFLWAGIL